MSYTQQYNRTYENWKQEQAKRILDILTIYFINQNPINLNDLILHVYHERLSKASFLGFRAIEKNQSFRLNDKKPSPFIKNFCYYLLERLSQDNYLEKGYWYEYELINDNLVLVDYGEFYKVKALPSLDYLVSIITWKDPKEIEYLAYKEAEKELNY